MLLFLEFLGVRKTSIPKIRRMAFLQLKGKQKEIFQYYLMGFTRKKGVSRGLAQANTIEETFGKSYDMI